MARSSAPAPTPSIMKSLSRYESEISSILGMLVVAALAVFIFLFVKRFMPKPSISPIAENTQDGEDLMKQANTNGTYTVKPGQGLTQIAVEVFKDKSMWKKIAEANDLKAPYTLEKGQVLKLPEATTPVVKTSEAKIEAPIETATPTSDTYIVVKGDSLWKIAQKQYGTGYAWVKIYQANKKLIGKNPGLLYSDITLVMPK